MEKQARLVIIGAGIVGCSAAYHLTKMGWKDIVVLDQGKAPFYGGSSSHAPGGAFQTNPSKLMTELAHYGAHFYHSLEYDGKKGAELSGGIELARTPERLTELKRRRGLGYSWGLEGEILTPKECKEKVPFLNEKEILGGYFVADDAIGRPVVCVQATIYWTTYFFVKQNNPKQQAKISFSFKKGTFSLHSLGVRISPSNPQLYPKPRRLFNSVNLSGVRANSIPPESSAPFFPSYSKL